MKSDWTVLREILVDAGVSPKTLRLVKYIVGKMSQTNSEAEAAKDASPLRVTDSPNRIRPVDHPPVQAVDPIVARILAEAEGDAVRGIAVTGDML